jgi:hypothetical protein
MRRLIPLSLAAGLLITAVAAAWPALAQEPPSAAALQASVLPAPPHVVYVEGEASLIRDGASDLPSPNAPLIEGDRLRTTRGRAEIGLPTGAAVFIDEHTTLDLRTTNRMRVLNGRIRLVAPPAAPVTDMVLDAPGVSLTPSGQASFLVDVVTGTRGDEVLLRVDDGVIELTGERDTMLVKAGESVAIRGGGPPVNASPYGRAERDLFDRWVAGRLDTSPTPTADASTASSNLPEDLRAYDATLAQYGTWDYEPDYGQVWYPSVTTDWRPYSVGYWDRVGAYGYYWVGADAWAWPTHYYGRWGYAGGRWFWAPGSVWGPAWVSWAVGPGYVGWCPLGYDNRPVFGFGVSIGSYWGYGGSYYGGRYYGHGDYWRGWNVMHADHFRGRGYRRGAYVDPRHLSNDVRSAFVTQRVPPSFRGGRTGPGGGGFRPGGAIDGPNRNAGGPRGGEPRGAIGTGPGYAVPRTGPSTGGADAYERARPFMNPRQQPAAEADPRAMPRGADGLARPRTGSPERSLAGEDGRPLPARPSPRAGGDQPATQGRSDGAGAWRSGGTPSGSGLEASPPSAVPRRSPPPAAVAPSSRPSGGDRAPGIPPSSPRGTAAPNGASPRSTWGATRSPSYSSQGLGYQSQQVRPRSAAPAYTPPRYESQRSELPQSMPRSYSSPTAPRERAPQAAVSGGNWSARAPSRSYSGSSPSRSYGGSSPSRSYGGGGSRSYSAPSTRSYSGGSRGSSPSSAGLGGASSGGSARARSPRR